MSQTTPTTAAPAGTSTTDGPAGSTGTGSPTTGPAPRPMVATIADLVGGTPLVALPTPGGAPGVRLYAKLESANPLSSVKDRTALWMMRSAEKLGLLRPGGTVVEATSGNTGIALAGLAAARGYRCVVVMPDNATPERIGLLTTLGAEVHLTPRDLRYQGCVDKARQLYEEIPGAWFAQQHLNPDNPRAHRESTGPEIWADTAGAVDALVAGIGTGGTISGTSAYLKGRNPQLRVVGVEPEGSPLLTKGYPGPHAIPGMNGGFVAPTTDVSLIDEVVAVSDSDAKEAALRLARTTGILAGISSGAAVHVAQTVATRVGSAGRLIVVLLPDTGERYLSMLTS